MIYVYEVHMEPPATEHGHIAEVKWKDPDNRKTGTSTREEMVEKISKEDVAVYVCGDSAHIARVRVVDADTPYIRTYADEEWKDNLLALPHY